MLYPWVRKSPWRRKWQPTPIFLPGKSHGMRSLVGYSPWIAKSWTWHSTKQQQQLECLVCQGGLKITKHKTLKTAVLYEWSSYLMPENLALLYKNNFKWSKHSSIKKEEAIYILTLYCIKNSIFFLRRNYWLNSFLLQIFLRKPGPQEMDWLAQGPC